MFDLKAGVLWVNRSLTQLAKKHGGFILEAPKTKSGYRQLKLPPQLLQSLREQKLKSQPNPNGLVFVGELNLPLRRKRINGTLAAACKEAGIKKILSLNNLRHSFASQNLLAGVSPLEVASLMGHSNVAITLTVYSQWTHTEKSVADTVLAARIFGSESVNSEAENQ